MSLLSRDRLAIAIYPERVVWLRATKGLRTVVKAKGIIPCATEKSPTWTGVLAALPQALKEAANINVSIVLSNRLVRYAITPNPDSANSREELDALTRHVFERTHGEVVSSWEIRLSDASPGHSALASAVDSDLLIALREAVAVSGSRLQAIQPYLMAAFKQQAGKNGVFVMVEPERLCQLAWKDGGWCGVQQTYANGHWHDTLNESLGRMTMNLALDAKTPIRVCAPELENTAVANSHWQTEPFILSWPAGLSPINDRAYAGAMLALN
ncbi:MAG: hypothetical protein ACKVN9_09720 [Methylophilaceae bacterium]